MNTHLQPEQSIDGLLTAWTTAEQSGDTKTLDLLLCDDFRGIGPVGFVIDKQVWLDRFAGGLQQTRVELSDIDTRTYDRTAVIVAHEHVDATHGGNPTPPELRISIVAVLEQSWRIAAIQHSFIAGTPGAPGHR